MTDLKFAFRQLAKKPGFTVTAVLSLALGIGANTAIFQLLDTVRLRTLPAKDPQELAVVRIADMTGARGDFQSPYPAVTHPIWQRFRDTQNIFSGVLAWGRDSFNVGSKAQPRYADALWVNGDFFNVLGVKPLLGQFFTRANDDRNASPAAVISFGFWQREFGGDPLIIGKQVTLDGRAVNIVGVAVRPFTGVEVGKSFDLALPIESEAILRPEGHRLDSGTTWWLNVMGRLKRGTSVAVARKELVSLSAGIFESTLSPKYPSADVNTYLGFKLTAIAAGNGVSTLREEYSKPLWLLLGIAGAVLLIACANLANLLLARAITREREVAVRLALGASKWRIVWQLLIESLMLAISGAVGGWLLAQGLSRFLIAFLTTDGNPLVLNLVLDWRIFGFTAAMSILTCALFGLAPAFRGAQISPNEALKSNGRGMTANRQRFRLRRALVVAQGMLALLLVSAATLFSLSLVKLMTVDAGFNQEGVIGAFIDFSNLSLPIEQRPAFKRALVASLRGLPGVKAAAETLTIPLNGNSWDNRVWMDGLSIAEGKDSYFGRVGGGYFQTFNTPIIAGREFDEHDVLATTKVAVVNETFARQIAKDSHVVGKRFWKEPTPHEPAVVYEIVGVVKDTKYHNLREAAIPIAFLPSTQDPERGAYDFFVVRAIGSPAPLIPTVTAALKQGNADIRTGSWVFKQQVQNSLLRERLMATLSGFFGVLALLLACVGLCGILSYGVATRTNEIGLRMALGAQRADVLWLIVREGLLLVLVSLVLGIPLVLIGTRLVSSLLYGVSPADPLSISGASLLLVIISLAAAYIPARRATRVDPMEALRYD